MVEARTSRRAAPVSAVVPALCGPAVGSLPYFLVGTLAVQLRAEFDSGPLGLGALAAIFPAGSAMTSIALGRFGDRIGASRSLRLASAASALSMLAIATIVRDLAILAVLLVLAGAANSLAQAGATIHIARSIGAHRFGFALGLKQIAGPLCTLLAGMAVPTLVVAFGWRSAFAAGGLLAVGVSLFARGSAALAAPSVPQRRWAGSLVGLSVASALAGVAAAAVTTFFVDAVTISGLPNGAAGILLAVASVCGIATRLGLGMRADRRAGNELRTVASMQAAGAIFLLLLTSGESWVVMAAGPLIFSTAWGWPGLLHLAVLRRQSASAGAAGGFIDMGLFVGSLVGPPILGVIASRHSYSAVWWIASACSVAGATITVIVVRRNPVEAAL